MTIVRRYAPLIIPEEKPLADLDLVVKIETRSGWLYLEDEEAGFTIHADTRKERQVTKRKQTTDNIWTEGSFDTSSVRGDVTENFSVWVTGETEFEFESRVTMLTDALDQMRYRIMWRLGNLVEYWTCKSADYSIQQQREHMHAMTGFVSARIPRHPQVSRGLATVDDI